MKTIPANTVSSKIAPWAGIRTVFHHELRQRIFNFSTAILTVSVSSDCMGDPYVSKYFIPK